MRFAFPAAVFFTLSAIAAPAAAQSEQTLRSYFEGMRVRLKIDMPGTSDGVDVRADAGRAIDYREYGDRLKTYGTAIRSGDSTTVTLIKMKRDLLEVQLGGGGFGTFSDDSSTSVYMPSVEKSRREKELERRVKEEDDSRARRELQRELDYLRYRRERENRRIEVERTRASEIKKERVAEQRLRGGSRFNVRYNGAVPPGLRPEDLMATLADYIEFSPASSNSRAQTPVDVNHADSDAFDTATLHKGMLRPDVERMLGGPYELSERHEGSLSVATLVFVTGDDRIMTDFVEDVLVRYSITSK